MTDIEKLRAELTETIEARDLERGMAVCAGAERDALNAERDKERQINDYLVKRTNELEAERDRYQAALQAIGGAHELVVGLSAIVTAKAALNGSDDE